MIPFLKGLFVIVLGTGSLMVNSPEAFHMCPSIILCLEGLVLNGRELQSPHPSTSAPAPCCLPTVQILRNQGSVHWTSLHRAMMTV